MRRSKAPAVLFLLGILGAVAAPCGPAYAQPTSIFEIMDEGGFSTNPKSIIEFVLPETRQLVENILRDYPADQWFYLCMGRSPTPLAEGLRMRAGYGSVRTIPMTGAKHLNTIELDAPMMEHWKAPYEILAQLLPSVAELKGRRLLVIDYAATGASFAAQLEIVEKVLNHRDREPPAVRGLSFYDDHSFLSTEALTKANAEFVKTPQHLGEAWMAAIFDWWSEYDEWRPLDSKKPPEKNERYSTFHDSFVRQWLGLTPSCESPLKVK